MKLKDILETPIEGVETSLQLMKALEGNGQRIEVSMRRLNPEQPELPIRSESAARAHRFFEVRGFIDYVLKFGGKDTVVFADPSRGVVQATLDENAAEGRETVVFAPMLHPQWEPWDRLLQKPELSLTEFLRHCANNRRGIIEPNARDLVLLFSQIQSCSKVDVAQGHGKTAVNGVLITTTIKGVESQDIGDLPDTIKLLLPIYIGTQPTEIEIDLTLSAKPGEGITITLAAGDLLEAKFRIFTAMCAQFDELKTREMTVTMGSVNEEAWEYLAEKTQQPAAVEKIFAPNNFQQVNR